MTFQQYHRLLFCKNLHHTEVHALLKWSVGTVYGGKARFKTKFAPYAEGKLPLKQTLFIHQSLRQDTEDGVCNNSSLHQSCVDIAINANGIT